jgi:cell division protein FtsZ
MTREELLEKLRLSRPAVTVVGLGGAGCNITTWISDKKLAGGKIIGANTDAGHLSTMTRADKIILLGEKLCKGHGCGGYPERGAEAAKENLDEIKEELKGTNLLFLVAGLGGGSGTGSIPVFASVGKEVGALTVACYKIACRKLRFNSSHRQLKTQGSSRKSAFKRGTFCCKRARWSIC